MSEGRLPKPQLRNLHLATVKRTLVMSIMVTAISGLVCKFLIIDPYERRFEEFYKTYDAEASLKKMNEAGLMQSAR